MARAKTLKDLNESYYEVPYEFCHFTFWHGS